MIPIGFTLQPDVELLELCDPLVHEADYLEITPETTWRTREDGTLVENDFHALYRSILDATAKPCVAHGVALSLGSARVDPVRRARWLEQLARDHARFRFRWYTEHLGVTHVDGRELTLPLPLPQTGAAAARVVASLGAMRTIVPDVGFENSAFYFRLGDALDEPAWIARVLRAADAWLLLDLHNVFTDAANGGFDASEYVERLPLERVIEIHVSGGGESDPRWLPSRRTLRLDGHDGAVPEAVWKLLELVLPRATNLRGITLERMEGTVTHDDVALLHDELRRARRFAELVHAR